LICIKEGKIWADGNKKSILNTKQLSLVAVNPRNVTGWVADHGEALYVADVWADPRYIGGVPGAVSEIAAPLRLNGTVIGVLDAELKRAGAFDEAHVELFSAFAAHAATAIHNARLLERLERRAADLTLLTRCGRELSSSLDLSIVLDRVLTLADGALRFERCAVLLRDDEGLLAVRAAHGYTDDVIRDLRIRPGEGVTGAVFATAGRQARFAGRHSETSVTRT